MPHPSPPHLLLLACLIVLSLPACDSTEDDPGVRIVRYDGPPIERTEFMDWVGQVEETLTGTRVVLTSTIGRDSLILFYEPNQELPVGGAVYYLDPNRTYAIRDGVIAIQDWKIDGIVSGQYEGALRGMGTTDVFWVDLSEQP